MKLTRARNALFGSMVVAFTSGCMVTTDGNRQTSQTTTNIPDRVATINFFGPVTERSVNNFKSNFNRQARNAPTVRINIRSIGGLSYGARDMINLMENSERQIITSCEGITASAGSTILITTDNAIRNAGQNCRIMIHAPHYRLTNSAGKKSRVSMETLSNALNENQLKSANDTVRFRSDNGAIISTTKANIEHLHNTIKTDRDILSNELARHSRLTKDDINTMFARGDTYFNRSEAAFIGFVDRIDGRNPNNSELQYGKQNLCSRIPEISLCR